MSNQLKTFIYNLCTRLARFTENYRYNQLLNSGRLTVGEGTYGTPTIYEYKGSESNVRIGNYTSIAPEVRIITGGIHPVEAVSQYPFRSRMNLPGAYTDGNPRTRGDINIGSDVWISTGVTILSGVTIGHGAIISAMATVTKDVPPFAIVAGSPAKVIRFRFEPHIISSLLTIQWWNWQRNKIIENVALLTSDDLHAFVKKHSA